MSELELNSDIIKFLNEKELDKKETEKLYQKTVKLFQKTQLKNKDSQSHQERLAFFKMIRFTASAGFVFSQIVGGPLQLDSLSELFTNDAIVGSLQAATESLASTNSILPTPIQERTADFFMEMSKWLDPDKVNLATPIGYIMTFGSASAGVRGLNLSKRRFYEEDIAKYSDDLQTYKDTTTKNAIVNFANFTDEYKVKKFLTEFTPFSKIGLFAANIVVDIAKTLFNPVKTVKKTYLLSKMGLNEVNYFMGDKFQDKLKKSLKRDGYLKELKRLEGGYDANSTAKYISSTETFKYQDIDATSEIGALDMVFNSVQSAYDDTLKINVKNSLAKSMMVLGDENSSHYKRREALDVLNKVSKLHENTEDNRFDHYKVISQIADDYIKKIKEDKKVYTFKPDKNLTEKASFDLARDFVNKKQEEKLKILGTENPADKNDPNKNIVDEMSFGELFDVSVKHQLIKLKRNDVDLDVYHKEKNDEISKKSKKKKAIGNKNR